MTTPARRAFTLLTRARQLTGNDQVILAVLAVIAGTVAGVCAIVFRESIHAFEFIFFGDAEISVEEAALHSPWWVRLLAPTAGGLVVGLLVWRLMPGGRPQGVADVVEAIALKGGRMSLRTGVKAALVSAVTLGAGGSAGREGPVVHFGASLGSWISRKLHLDRNTTRTLVGSAVAAAVAASFDAPIAGVFFALEVVVGHYTLSAFAPVVIASVAGTMVSRAWYGEFPAFIVPRSEIVSPFEFFAFMILGALCGLVAVAFSRNVALIQKGWQRVPLAAQYRPMFGGLAVGIIALAFPEVMGVGYTATDLALREQLAWDMMLALLAAKLVATGLTLGSGFGGGVFSPSLFLGAMLGGAFGLATAEVFPAHWSGHGAYAMVGMGAVAGAVLGAPISTILMVFELTRNYQVTVAVMVATVVAGLVTSALHHRSFFQWQLRSRGVNLRRERVISLLRDLTVADAMKPCESTVDAAAPLEELRRALRAAPFGILYVVDEGVLRGVVSFADLHDSAYDRTLDGLVVALDVARRDPLFLEADDDLEKAQRVMGASGEYHLPVVDNAHDRKLVGRVRERDVVIAHNWALVRERGEE